MYVALVSKVSLPRHLTVVWQLTASNVMWTWFEENTRFPNNWGINWLWNDEVFVIVWYSIAGIIVTYAIIHLALWWIFNICAIFWKVQFPFHSRFYDQTNRTRYVHITCVVAAIILPVYAPLAIALKGGFIPSRFPPFVCLGRDVDAIFYTVIAPSTVILSIGTTLLLLIFWRIRQVRSSKYNYII